MEKESGIAAICHSHLVPGPPLLGIPQLIRFGQALLSHALPVLVNSLPRLPSRSGLPFL